MPSNNIPNPPGYYPYKFEIRVDQAGNGDYDTIKDACDAAALLPRGTFDPVAIRVGDGIYTEEPFTVPTFTSLIGFRQGNTTLPGASIVRGLGGTLDPSETEFITLAGTNKVYGFAILAGLLSPANFNTEYALVRSTTGAAVFDRCNFALASPYNGANPCYLIKHEPTSLALVVNRSVVGGTGSGVTQILSNAKAALYYMQFFGTPDIAFHSRQTGPPITSDSSLTFVRMSTDVQVEQPISYDVFAEFSDTFVRLIGTRVPHNRRGGAGVFVEMHPTPRQLGCSHRMLVRTIDDTDSPYSVDAYDDGTIRCDATAGPITVDMPPVASVGEGEAFVIKKVDGSANAITINGDGVETIDGLGSATISIPQVSHTLQANGTGGGWDII